MNIEEMRTRLDEVRDELETLLELDELDDDQSDRYDELEAEGLSLSEDIEQAEQRQSNLERIRSAQRTGRTVPGAYAGGTDGDDPLGEPGSMADTRDEVWDLDEVRSEMVQAAQGPVHAGPLRSRALTAIEEAPGLNDETRERLTNLVEFLDFDDEETRANEARVASHIVATSSPEYLSQWKRALRAAMDGSQDMEAMQTLSRAASLTDAAGGFAVPLPIDPTLIVDDDLTVNPFREIATQRTIVTDQLRTVSAGAVSFSWDGEAAEVSDDTPTWANIDITAHKLQGFIPFSIEIGQDYPGFTQDLRMLFAEGRNNAEAAAFATGSGDGSNQPVGIVTALTGTTSEITSNTTDVFAIGDVYDLEEELPARFRRNRPNWVANKRIYQSIREAGGQNLDDFWVNLGGGQPSELLGYPTRESPDMDGTIDATVENRVLILGDFTWYWIVDRVGFSVELIPHLFATANNRPSGQRGLYAYLRVGADSVMDRAFRMLNVT